MKSVFYSLIVLGLYSLSFMNVTQARTFNIQVENSMEEKSIIRNSAQNNKTVHFNQGDVLRVQFCLRKTSIVDVSNILFSNDGGPDKVQVYLDGTYLDSFYSTWNSNYGHNWDVFSSSGQIGTPRELLSGRHILKFTFNSTDAYGIELDAIELTFNDAELQDDFLLCTMICEDDITYSNIKSKDNIPSAELIQKSTTTFCGMDRNVNYQVFHPTVNDYKITATPPKYRSLMNDVTSDTSGCDPISNIIWKFSKLDGLPDKIPGSNTTAEMMRGTSASGPYINVTFTFDTERSVTRQDDIDVGAVITLELETTSTVVLKRSTRAGTVEEITPTSTNGNTVTWTVPEFSWATSGTNFINLSIPPGSRPLVKLLKMERKAKVSDVETTIYDSGTKIVFVKEDQWWAAPSSMLVVLSDASATYDKITRISVFRPRRFTDGYDEIFQLYQDGMTNINAMVPNGGTSVPFRTSFILGQFAATDKRPYAPIKNVTVDPSMLKFSLVYEDGATADLEVIPKGEDTEIHITNATYIKDRDQFPFVGVRATWVADGNADIDHVTANQNEPKAAVNAWGKLYGTAFSFFKQCISMHNPQGSDYQLELLNA